MSAARSVRAAAGEPSPRVLELTGRAALAEEAAIRTARPAEPFAHAGGDAVACELYREAVHWALLAHLELGAGARAADAASDEAAPTPDLVSVLERVNASLLTRAAGGEAALEALRPKLAGSYREYAELGTGEQRKLAESLELLARGLLEPLGSIERQLERIWLRRVLHIVVLAALLGVAVWGADRYSQWESRKHDYAKGAAWTTSSLYPVGGCKSPEQRCAGGENYFFHTMQEQDPWVIFDLGRERRFSVVEVDNRLDCCPERAYPLAIDVSEDKKHWKEVARSKSEFTSLRKHFSTVKARYVRLHVPTASAILHLSAVRVLP